MSDGPQFDQPPVVVAKSVQQPHEKQVITNGVINGGSPSPAMLVEDLSTESGFGGDRIWAVLADGCANSNLKVSLTRDNGETIHVDELRVRDKLVTFTLPNLSLNSSTPLSLCFASGSNVICLPFMYKIKTLPSPEVCVDNLMEFASGGDTLALVAPLAALIPHQDHEGNTVLHVAARNSQSYALKTFLSAVPQQNKATVVNIQNERGQTALHCAIRAGDPDSVHYLMSNQADANITDKHGNTSLHYLADAYNEAIYKELLERASDLNLNLGEANEEGMSALHVSVKRLKLGLIEMLLEAGAPLEQKDAQGKTALLHAVIMNDTEIVQFLLQKGAEANVEDSEGETPLLTSSKTANYAIMSMLLDNGADPHKKNCKDVSLSDSDESRVQSIINGERVQFSPKQTAHCTPTDLATSRTPLFGRSNPANPDDDELGNVIVRNPGDQLDDDDDENLELGHFDNSNIPSTSSAGPSRVRTKARGVTKFNKDDISNLDYLTRLRISKLLDEGEKWKKLAQELACDHMIELISICTSDDSSATMIFLDQFEQLPDANISRVYAALEAMGEAEALKLLDDRIVY
ncbi:hypothetical protein WR25_15689 isoform A [Diploscapter pachys]|uniref:Death domain-containing protein n=1 Tax=Diploscapter pachys TaxID=2018661 RepID=A0A2A2J368_9BILA|nr:hypothetical protein WR25_15689 isoform A [Diploscapter pachys]